MSIAVHLSTLRFPQETTILNSMGRVSVVFPPIFFSLTNLRTVSLFFKKKALLLLIKKNDYMEDFAFEEIIKNYSFKVILFLVKTLPKSFGISKLTRFLLNLG